MAANYQLVSSQSSIQVLSPTVVLPVVVCTIQTLPSRVIADIWVSEDEWNAGRASDELDGFAANIEAIMASPKVVGGSSRPGIDPSGLQATDLIFTVGYKTPGSQFPPATVDVAIPSTSIRPEGAGTSAPGVVAALGEIDKAYATLAAAAGAGTADVTASPPPPPQVQ